MISANKVQALERELRDYKAEIGQLKESLSKQESESGRLEEECAKLRSALVDVQAKAGSQDEDDELKARIIGQYLSRWYGSILTIRT
jgi:regulator of replication initiation timing